MKDKIEQAINGDSHSKLRNKAMEVAIAWEDTDDTSRVTIQGLV